MLPRLTQSRSTSRSNSISPSDSVSHLGPPEYFSTTSRLLTATRPPQYPQEILWTLEDCQKDEDASPSPSNPSRPPMERAIRHPDGRMISAAEWTAICATSRQICAELVTLHFPTDRRHRGRAKTTGPTKTMLRTTHPVKWREAIERLEKDHPILALCALHWKAEHTLGHTLMSRNQRSKLNPQESDLSDDHSAQAVPALSPPPPAVPALGPPPPAEAAEDQPPPLRRSPRKLPPPAQQAQPNAKRPAPPTVHPNKRRRKPINKTQTLKAGSSEVDELIDELIDDSATCRIFFLFN
jgi:hypothetical protein